VCSLGVQLGSVAQLGSAASSTACCRPAGPPESPQQRAISRSAVRQESQDGSERGSSRPYSAVSSTVGSASSTSHPRSVSTRDRFRSDPDRHAALRASPVAVLSPTIKELKAAASMSGSADTRPTFDGWFSFHVASTDSLPSLLGFRYAIATDARLHRSPPASTHCDCSWRAPAARAHPPVCESKSNQSICAGVDELGMQYAARPFEHASWQ
jgi:hypothetical protein